MRSCCSSIHHPRVRSNKPATVCAPDNLVKWIITWYPQPHPLQERCSPVLFRSHKSCRTLMIYQAGLGLPLHLVWWTNQKLISTFVQRGCWLINYYWLWAWLPSAAKRHLKKKKKTTNKNWAAVVVFKFIKTKYIIFYEAVLKWVTEGEHIDWERMNFSNFCSLETEFNYNTRQTG